MKDTQYVWVVFIITVVVAATFLLSGCTTPPPDRSVCEECCEGIEDPYLCSKYYVEKEVLRMEARNSMEESKFGSHDFFLKEDSNYEN